jgi:hypothetical protein
MSPRALFTFESELRWHEWIGTKRAAALSLADDGFDLLRRIRQITFVRVNCFVALTC